MRYSLPASAGLAALSAVFALVVPAQAADCGCRDAVRAALARQIPAPPPMPAVKPPAKRAAARVAHRTVPACNCGPAPRPMAAAPAAQGGYNYASAGAVNTYPYTHHWTVAPQGYVPPMNAAAAAAAAGIPPYDGPTDLPPYGPMPAGYGEAAGGGAAYAYGAAPAITVEQQGWIGGVGYERSGGGGGGGGGGGMTLTLAQPDSGNGPSYNSFGQSYGGDYQSANQVNAWRTQAFTPPANSGSGSGSK